VQGWDASPLALLSHESAIRREMSRRAAIEPVIGHLKQDHRMGRNYLTGRDGDRINAVLAAAGYTSACSCAGSRSFYVSSR
jgi:hypothetical protein